MNDICGSSRLSCRALTRAESTRCPMLGPLPREAQPILGSTLHWRIVDAKRGVLEEGDAELSDLAKRKPWDYGDS